MAAALTFPTLPQNWTERELYTNTNQFVRIFHRNESLLSARAKTSDTGQPLVRVLVLVHGFGEHSGRYLHFPEYLQSCIDVIIAPDLPGHGNSKGNRGHFGSIENLHDCLAESIIAGVKWLKDTNLNYHLHLFGHSFGGLFVCHSMLVMKSLRRLDFSSIILSSPFLGFGFPVPKIKKQMGLLIEPLMGWLPMKSELDANHLSHDPAVVDAYKRDPLNHEWITPRSFVGMSRMMEEVSESNSQFPCPWILIQPTKDPISSVATNEEFYSRINRRKGVHSEFVKLEDFYHEGFNEVGKELAFSKLADWLSKH